MEFVKWLQVAAELRVRALKMTQTILIALQLLLVEPLCSAANPENALLITLPDVRVVLHKTQEVKLLLAR